MFIGGPPPDILEYFIPLKKCETALDEEPWVSGYAEEESDEESVNLEQCSLVEIDERIAALKDKMDGIASLIHGYEKARHARLNHPSQDTS